MALNCIDKLNCRYSMGTNCAPLVADLFLLCYENNFMLSLSDINQSDASEAVNSTSRTIKIL